MPKINPENNNNLSDKMSQFPEIQVSTTPVLVCAVSRKINIGNFETVDIYSALSIPLANGSWEEKEKLEEYVRNAAEFGFGLVSQETGSRYSLIKEASNRGR